MIVPSRARGRQSGQVLVLVLLGTVALFGAVGLGIDASRSFEERRDAQTAVDHAATAAAFASCSGGDEAAARSAGRAAATQNGFDDASASVVVNVDPVVGQTDTYHASIISTIGGTFARIIGLDDFTITVIATASAVDCGAGGAGPGAIFAGGTCPSGKWAVDISGSTNRVFGGVHSNDDVNVGGGSNDFDDVDLDPFTYVGSIDPSSIGNGNAYEVPYPAQVGAMSWPAGYDPSVAAPASSNDAYWSAWSDKAIADGHGGILLTSKIASITSNGVYYTSHADGMDIGSISPGVTNITLIARNGPIKISASGGTFSPDPDGNGILALSGKDYTSSGKHCEDYTVALSGSDTDWNGIIWAPGGLIEFSGSSNSAVNGTLMGQAVRLNGSNLVLRYDSTPFESDPTVLMLQ